DSPYRSNWELSTARALAVVRFLADQGIPEKRMAATGFSKFHPLDPRNTAEAYQRNRRIEIKLTSR
ncbi:MAG: OmpA family protein, partial [Desulfuromonadaceae bacterium]